MTDIEHRSRARRLALSRPARPPERQRAVARRPARGDRRGAAVRADDAAHRQAVLGADDELRPARLGLRPRRLSLPGAPPRHRPPVAGRSPTPIARVWARAAARSARAGSLPRQLLRGARQDGPAPGPRRARASTCRCCRSRSAIDAHSASAASTRNAPTRSFPLRSGDVFTFGGASRLAFHGVDRMLPGTSTLLPEGGRFNLTLRRVNPA